MAQITLNVADDKEQRFINAFASVFGWHADSGMTKRQFMKSKLRDYMKETLYAAEIAKVNGIAAQTLQTDIDAIDVS